MDSTSESSSEFSESENAETSVRVDPFRDDPVWNPSLASACDIQGAEGKRTVINVLIFPVFFGGKTCVLHSLIYSALIFFKNFLLVQFFVIPTLLPASSPTPLTIKILILSRTRVR